MAISEGDLRGVFLILFVMTNSGIYKALLMAMVIIIFQCLC